jgi:type IV secretory pathway VirB10-like protein
MFTQAREGTEAATNLSSNTNHKTFNQSGLISAAISQANQEIVRNSTSINPLFRIEGQSIAPLSPCKSTAFLD